MTEIALCAGYGGSSLALGTTPDYVSEIDPHASRILAARFPDAVNLGDLTACAEWPRADVVTAGFPCQPFSGAGSRKGTEDERWIWPYIVECLRRAEPAYVFLECTPDVLTLHDGRAATEIFGSLSALGFDAEWGVVPASAVGACHRRKRWWCVARHPDREPESPIAGTAQGPRAEPHGDVGGSDLDLLASPTAWLGRREAHAHGDPERWWNPERSNDLSDQIATLLPTPWGSAANGPGRAAENGDDSRLEGAVDMLLPTPTVAQPGGDADGNRQRLRDVDGREPSFIPLNMLVEQELLLPTPTGSDAKGPSPRHAGTVAEAVDDLAAFPEVALLPTPTVVQGRNATSGRTNPKDTTNTDGWTLNDIVYANLWDRYGPAIARHEVVFRQPAPCPTILNPKAKRGVSLNPVFVEWMMGLPEGWVTDPELDLPRTAQLRALGNGQVPLCARTAWDLLASRF